MIVVMKNSASSEEILRVTDALVKKGMQVQTNKGVDCTVLGVLGDTYMVDKERVGMMNGVDRVVSIQEPYKKANRKFHPEDSVVDVNGVSVGGGTLTVMAGPCSVESFDQLEGIARQCKSSGAQILRGGAFKPRASPYAFQGLERNGIKFLLECKREYGIPIVTEIMGISDIPLFEDVDIIQVGARNMQNFRLLKELGHLKQPILLKRGLANTIEELLMSAEYIMSGGNENVILCERGIRTFETYTRNTFDLSAIPMIKRISHLPVIADPSHAAGLDWMVEPLAKAAVAAGADGIMIEVHNDPPHALSDGKQSLTPARFAEIMEKLKTYISLEGKKIG